MAAILHLLDQRRLIDSNGIADGASIYFYATGTLTPATVYTTAALDVAHPSPIVVNAGAAVPDIYLDSTVTYRRRIVYPDGSVDDTDPYTSDVVSAAVLATSGGAGQVGFQRSDTGAVLRTADAKLKESVFTPQDFGAAGDGVTDDTTAIQNALTAAKNANGTFLLTEGTYRVTDNLYVYNGIRRILGEGGVILMDQASGQASFILAVSGGVPVSNCLVEGIVINANAKQTLGIYGQNITDCTIRGNRIYGLTATTGTAYGIFVKSLQNFAIIAQDVRIEGNLIEGQETHASHVAGQQGIVISGDWTTPYNGYADATAEWKATFDNIAPTYTARRIVVKGNIVKGGRYGISLIGTTNCTVESNQSYNNTRSLSIQLRCIENEVTGNIFKDYLACAVEIGYSCFDNNVSNNATYSSVADSLTEGALLVYVGSKRNRYEGNKVRITSANGPAYYLYAAIHADDNTFFGNECSGPVRRAGMAVESSWDNTITNTSHRAEAQGATLNDFANTLTTNVSFIGNELNLGSSVNAIFLAQVTDTGTRTLSAVTVSQNRIRGSASRIIQILEETSGNAQTCIFTDNMHASSNPSAFSFPRGVGHFSMFSDHKLTYTVTWDPPSIATGSSATTTVSVAGAEIGDEVAVSFSNSLSGLSMTGYVSAAGTVTVVLVNNTGGAVDLGSGTVRVRVRKQ